jgi:hypothetical protein
MTELMMLAIYIPLIDVAIRFWVGVAKWGTRNGKTIVNRIQKVKSAFSED